MSADHLGSIRRRIAELSRQIEDTRLFALDRQRGIAERALARIRPMEREREGLTMLLAEQASLQLPAVTVGTQGRTNG